MKNDNNLLPLDVKRIKTLAVIGPNADKTRLGTYSGIPPYFVSVLDGIRKRAGQQTRVAYAEGCRISEPDSSPSTNSFFPYKAPNKAEQARGIQQAVETARNADVIVLVLGGNESVSRESFGNGGGVLPVSYGDADTLELPGDQEELVRQISELGKPTAAILLNGKAYAVTNLVSHASAIMEGWYLGQETGNSIAGVFVWRDEPFRTSSGDHCPECGSTSRFLLQDARSAPRLCIWREHATVSVRLWSQLYEFQFREAGDKPSGNLASGKRYSLRSSEEHEHAHG